jgi:hypothetical protein
MRKVLKRLVDFIFYAIVILIVIALLFILSYCIYFQSNLTKVISGYPGMGDMRIEFDRVDTDIFSHYPEAQFSFHNLKVIDGSDSDNENYVVDIDQVSIDIKNSAWQDKRVIVKDIQLDSGSIFIHRDSLGRFNFSDFISSSRFPSDHSDQGIWSVDTDSLNVRLNNMLLSYVTDDKHQSIVTSARHGTAAVYNEGSDRINIKSTLDLKVLDFTLNEDNGSFFKDADISGPLDILIDTDGIHIDKTELKVNDQNIITTAEFFNNKEKYSYLKFVNKSTEFESIKKLLTPSLQTTLIPYRINGRFEANATLTIMPSHPLRVDINYVLKGNDVYIRNQIFYNTKVSGHFVNDKYYDASFSKIIKDKGYIRFDIDNANTLSNGADIRLDRAVILAGKGHPATIVSDAQISGPTDLISTQLNNDKFLFSGGTFNIDAALEGRFNNVQNMITRSDLNLEIIDCDVQYLPSQVVLPLQSFQLEKEAGEAHFNVVGLTADEEFDLNLNGSVTNLMGLLYDLENTQSVTNVNLKARRLSWEDFIHILGEGNNNNVNKSELEKRQAMKKTLRGFQTHFQPNINLRIDTSGYYDFTSIEDIAAHMHFPTKDILVIDSASFNLKEGHVDFNCKIDISSDELTPFEINCNAKDINLSQLLPSFDFFKVEALRNLNFLPKDFDIKMRLNGIINDSTGIIDKSLSGDIVFNSTKRRIEYAHINFKHIDSFDTIENKLMKELVSTIKIRGNPLVFNSYLDNDQFFFNEGDFELDINYTGQVFSLEQVISDGDISLTIDSSYVLFDPLSVTFPLTHIDLIVEENDAIYNFLMESDSLNQKIKFDGTVQNVSELIIEDTGQQVHTTSNIYSPRITWKNFIDIFNIDTSKVLVPIQDNSNASTRTSTSEICDLIFSFSPDISVRFDTIEYSDNLSIYNFNSDLSLVDSIFYITGTHFDYRDAVIALDSEIHISDDIDQSHVSLDAKHIDIEYLLADVESLTQRDVTPFKYISGSIDLNADISRYYRMINEVSDTAMSGDVKFEINGLIIDEAPWMKQIGKKVLHPHRFNNVKFASISNHLTLRNDTLHIPLMELQSNAFEGFVEGFYHRDHPNIWLSLPLYNLKERDLSAIPENEGYPRRRMKMHLEYANHDKPKPNFKLRLSKRKFYKDRGQLALWKELKKSR